MLKRVAWLWIPVLLVSGSLAFGHAKSRFSPPNEYDSHEGEVRKVVKILRTNNKAQTNTYVPLVYRFKNNNPFNVIRFLRRPVQLEEGDLFTFVNDSNDGGLVLFIVPPYMEGYLSDLVKRLDVAGLTTSSGTARVWRPLKHRRAVSKAEIALSSSHSLLKADEDFIETAASFSTGNGSFLLTDREVNALFYSDAPSGVDALDAALDDWLDYPTASATFEVKVYELAVQNDGKIGLDYITWKKTLGENLFAGGAFTEFGGYDFSKSPNNPNLPDPLGTGAHGLPNNNFDAEGYNFAYNYSVSSEFFDYLAVKGKAQVLNNMRLSILNAASASISAGDQFLVYAVWEPNSSDDGIRNTGQIFDENDGRDLEAGIAPVEVDMSMDLHPRIAEQTVSLEIDLEWSDYVAMGSGGYPIINSADLSTEVRLNVGDEIVIGGINRQTEQSNTQKIPILGSLPVIGWFAGGEAHVNQTDEIVIALKLTEVMEYGVASDYSIPKDDQSVIDKANGNKDIKLPDSHWGFDMYGQDPDRGTPVKSLK
jgi:type II secretory pathway component GspD/PulD (secretin)